jgi:hypothetical protein
MTGEQQTRAEILLHDYNRYRAHTFRLQQLRQKHPIRDVGPKKGIPIFEKLDAWCQTQSIDSRRWLYHVFKVRKWLFAPALYQLIPAKASLKRRLAAYHEMTDTPLFADTLRQDADLQRCAEGTVLDRNRDLIPMAESMKQRYLTECRPDKCIAAMWEDTYGYHPKSKVCAVCPMASQCEIELQGSVSFDISALRRGEITIQQAQMVAERSRYGV